MKDNEKKAAYKRRWYAKNKERVAAYAVSYMLVNSEKRNAYKREFDLRRRKTVLNHYGGKCICCGEGRFEFLSIDHKEGGGSKHRKETGSRGNGMVAWIISNGFPPIFQVMCHNCNQARGYYGECPHERERKVLLLQKEFE